MRRPLLLKLTGLVLVVTLLSMGVTTFFVTLFASNTIIENLYIDLISDAKLVSYWLESYDDWKSMEIISRLGEKIKRTITLIDHNGKAIVDSDFPNYYLDDLVDYPEVQQALHGEIGKARRTCEITDQEMIYVALPFKFGIVRVATTANEIMYSLSSLSKAAIILTCLVSAASLGVAYLVNRNITDPLEEILEATKSLQLGEFGSRVLVRSTDEIGQLGRAFNELSLTLEEMFNTIHDRENKLNAVLTSMDDGVLAVDTNLKIILANRSVAEMVNEDQDSLIGKELFEVIQSYQLIEIVADAMTSMKSIVSEIKLYPGSSRIMAVNISPLEGESKSTIGVVIVLRNITELRRLENMRKEFVANVSHELRTPLTSIKGFVETILNDKSMETSLVERFLTIVNGETDRMIALINDLLDLSRIESGKEKPIFEVVNIKKVFADTIIMFGSKMEEKEITIENRLEDLLVMGDPKLLRQVTTNLIDNAIKYNKEGGQVWIDAVINEDIAEISVRDTGFGIPHDRLERIFERFYRVDKGRSRQMGGTGLGLSIIKHIIERHNGEIHAESELGEGTTITFTLKLAKQA